MEQDQHEGIVGTTRRFRIWVQGRLDEGFSEGLAEIEQEDVSAGTMLTGELLDQSQLHGTLDLLRNLGIDVLRFEVDPPSTPARTVPVEHVGDPGEALRHSHTHASNERPSMRDRSHEQEQALMNVAIIFDSQTGTTKAAAEAMAEQVRAAGHLCTVSSVQDADPATVSAADAICVGSWCKGLFFVRQHATQATMDFIDGLGNVDGKPAAVFCTYKTATGKMLPEMAARLQMRGAVVTGSYKSRGPVPPAGFTDWIANLVGDRDVSRRDA